MRHCSPIGLTESAAALCTFSTPQLYLASPELSNHLGHVEFEFHLAKKVPITWRCRALGQVVVGLVS